MPHANATIMALSIVDSVTSIVSLLDCLENLPTQPPSLYLDIEGVKLSRHGSISIIQLLVFPLNHVFLIDVHILQDSAFCTPNLSGSTLKSVLESESVPKVFFDVRNDADALFAHFQISMQGVQDIQLLEVASRPYSKQRVSGLADCIENDIPLAVEAKEAWKTTKESGKALFNSERGGSYEVFNVRPMWQEIIDYCTNDVVYLPVLWDIYSRKLSSGWAVKVEEGTRKRLLESQSVSYKPHGKDKTLSPWARSVKSGKSKHSNNRAKHDSNLSELKQQGRAELVVIRSIIKKEKKQPESNLVHQPPMKYTKPKELPQEAQLNSLIEAQYHNRVFVDPPSLSKLALRSKPLLVHEAPKSSNPPPQSVVLPSTWICSTCDRMMQEDQKQAHLDGKPHKARMEQAAKATSTSFKVTTKPLGITKNVEHVPVLPNQAYRSKIRSAQTSPVTLEPPPYSAVPPSNWTCTTCSRVMHQDQMQAHLAGKTHKARLNQVQNAKSAAPIQATTTAQASSTQEAATVTATSSRKLRTRLAQNATPASPGQNAMAPRANPSNQASPATIPSSSKKGKPKYRPSGKSSRYTTPTAQPLGHLYEGDFNYGICDKDCGWCGHCMDGVNI